MPSTIQCHTPSYVPNGREVAVFSTERGLVRVRLAGRVAPSTWGISRSSHVPGSTTGLSSTGGRPASASTAATP